MSSGQLWAAGVVIFIGQMTALLYPTHYVHKRLDDLKEVLHAEMAALRAEMSAFKAELRAEFESFRAEVRAEFAKR